MHEWPGHFRELIWRDYVLVDAWTYRTTPKHLVFVSRCQVLCHVRACQVLEQVLREDRRLYDGLLTAFGIPRYQYEWDTRAALQQLLGAPRDRFAREVDRFAKLIVFERERLNSRPPPQFEIPSVKLAPLSATSSWVCIECVDDRQPPQPVPSVALEIVTASGDVRTVRSDQEGMARIDGIAPGRVTVRVLGIDGKLWRPVEGEAAVPSPKDERHTWHPVQRGECLGGIAYRNGFTNWQDIWNFRLNTGLREQRKRPDLLHLDDMLAVPALSLREIYRETEATHRIAVERGPARRGYVLESQDLRFHRDSCVFLGESSDPSDPETLAGASGVDALATALLHAHDNPEQKLLIVGHSDVAGDAEQNRKLSETRALALKHSLLGQRDAWVELVKEHSTIADYQQLLAWFSIVRGRPCAPFEIGGVDAEDNRRILRAFQAAYNRDFAASIREDGAIGPETWGAIFDVYREQLTYRLETDAEGLRALGDGVQFCAAAEAHGSGSALALRSGAAEDAPAYRRVDLMFFEPGEEPVALDLETGPPASPAFSLTSIPVDKGPALVWFSLQTVDELGHRLPDVELVFRSGDREARHTTDSRGLWNGQVRAEGKLELSAANGSALGLGAGSAFNETVELSPQWAAKAITDVVVQGAVDAELLQAHAHHLARYDAAPEGAEPTLRAGVTDAKPAREPMEQPSQSGEGTMPTRRAIRARAADNLFMAAELDFAKLTQVLNV